MSIFKSIIPALAIAFIFTAPAFAVIEVPTNKHLFPTYAAISAPVTSSDPSRAEPLGVGSVAKGGDMLSPSIGLDQFSGPVDIYLGYVYSERPSTVTLLKPDLTFQSFSLSSVAQGISSGNLPSGVVPWMQNTAGPINKSFFRDIPASRLPAGTYKLYLLVTPAGKIDAYYLWSTEFIETTLTIILPGLPATVNPVLTSVKTLEAETAVSIASVDQEKKSERISLKTRAVPQVAFADISTSDGNELNGHSHVLRPVEGKELITDLQMVTQTSLALYDAAEKSKPLVASSDAGWPPADLTLVGVPSSGFTVVGADLSGRAVASLVESDLFQASCYRQGGGFAVVETDPDKLAILQAEIDLSNSQWADPSTRMQNRYVAPSESISGNWTSDGTNLTITYSLTDSAGNEVMSKSDTGPLENFSDMSSGVAKQLADAMCPKQWKGTSKVTADGGWTYTAEVTWELAATQDTPGWETYWVKEGTATANVPLNNCVGGGNLTFPIGQSDGTLSINTTTGEYEAEGYSGDYNTFQYVCSSGSGQFTQEGDTRFAWIVIGRNTIGTPAYLSPDGNSFSGSYDLDNTGKGHYIIEWNFTKVQ